MPAPIPAPLPPWGRALLWLAETVITGLYLQHFDYAAEMSAVGDDPGNPEAGTWRRYITIVENSVSGESADNQTFSVDIANITNGQLDSSWNDADYATVWTQYAALLATIYPITAAYLRFKETRVYVMGFNPYTNEKPFANSGEPVKVYPLATQGTGSGMWPPQASSTITERTAAARHWGRVYLPSLPMTTGTNGRYATARVDALAAAWHTSYTALMQAEFFPVVPTTQADNVPKRTLQVVTGVQVDDVPDVQRSRRLSNVLYRKTLPLA